MRPPEHFNCRCELDDWFPVEFVRGPRDGEVWMVPLANRAQFYDGAQFGVPWEGVLYLYTYQGGHLEYGETEIGQWE